MERPDIERLFAAGGLQHPCDLDLVLFFRRHPDTLITSEQLAKFVGHDLRQVGRSLDVLVERQVVLRSPNPTHVARRYRLAPIAQREWLHRLLRIADTLEGRRELRQLLRDNGPRPESTASSHNPGPAPEPEDIHA